ncbi:MAG: hypothetical protein J7J44_06965 [Deltaproteobacteria bacterium]|nr:hypothetical protein [Deltaproteobacteria bacterium]
MNKAKIYPWIFAVVFGVVGIIACMKVGQIYDGLSIEASWRFGDKSVMATNDVATIFDILGLLSSYIMFFSITMLFMKAFDFDIASSILGSFIVGLIFGPMFFAIIIHLFCKNSINVAGASFGLFIGVITGLIIGIGARSILKLLNSIIICSILGIIIGQIFCSNGLIVCSPLLLAFASVGYAIGNPITEKAEQRAEIKRREELERERIRREEERRRLEYEQKIREYKSKVEQWEREGYDVSRLKKRWFK